MSFQLFDLCTTDSLTVVTIEEQIPGQIIIYIITDSCVYGRKNIVIFANYDYDIEQNQIKIVKYHKHNNSYEMLEASNGRSKRILS